MPRDESYGNILDRLDRLYEGIYGVAGDDDRPGILIKIDRLEQAEILRASVEKNRKYWLMTSMISCFIAFFTVVIDLATRTFWSPKK